jgi:hypothetical protein
MAGMKLGIYISETDCFIVDSVILLSESALPSRSVPGD